MERTELNSMLQAARIEFGLKTAVIEDTGSVRKYMTYEELWDTSCSLSEALSQLTDDGMQNSQFIGVCVDQCLIYPAVILGIHQHGLGFACVDPAWSFDKQMEYLQNLGAWLLIHDSEERTSNSKEVQCCVQVRDSTLYFKRLKFEGIRRKCLHPMAYAVLTSGSTGKPKIVRVPYRSIVPNVIAFLKTCDINSSDIIFLSSPSTFDPSVVDLFMAFSTGATLLITSKSIKASPTHLLQVLFPPIKTEKVSVLQTTPSVFNRWSEKELRDVVLGPETSLRILLLGGEPFPSYSKLQRCKCPGNNTCIYNIYGITEVSAWASIHFVPFPPTTVEATQTVHNVEVPLGRPLLDTIFEVRDVTTDSVIETGCGELFIGSFGRICEIDDDKCVDYEFPVFRSTGDIVEIDHQGNIFYVGRNNLVIKRWGHRVNLEKVEHIALSHPSVKNAFSSVDDASNKLYLFVTVRDDFLMLDLRKHFLHSVGSDKALIPDEFIQIQDILLTEHGKVNRAVDWEHLEKTVMTSLQLHTKKTVFQYMCDVLGLQTLQEGSFVELGGSSLLAMILVSGLEKDYGSVPENFVKDLLSEKSVSSTCEMLCTYYQKNDPLRDAVSTRLEVSDPEDLSNEQDAQNSNNNPENNDLPYFNFPKPTLEDLKMTCVWKVNMGKCIDASPVCTVYESGEVEIVIGAHSGRFMNINGERGQILWSISLPSRIETTACASTCGQYVYIGCYNGVLYCVDRLQGKTKWSFTCKAKGIKSIPVICNAGKTVMFGSYDNNVYCINSATGNLMWRFSESESKSRKGNWHAAPLVVGKMTILCCLSGMVYAIKTSNKALLWEIDLKEPIFSTPVYFCVSSGTYVVVAHVRGCLHCVDAGTGKQVWFWQAGGMVYAPLTIVPVPSHNDKIRYHILVSCYDSYLYCLTVNDIHKFSTQWELNLGASIACAAFPFIIKTSDGCNHFCAVVSNKCGVVFLICLKDGSICCQFHTGAEVFSTPSVHHNRVYFGCRDDNFYSLVME